MEKSFDRGVFNKLDRTLKKAVDTHYAHCLHKCNLQYDTKGNVPACKQSCYKDIQVPYKILLH